MVLEPVRCPVCHGIHVNKYGKTEDGKQRYICRNKTCSGKTFIREYSEGSSGSRVGHFRG